MKEEIGLLAGVALVVAGAMWWISRKAGASGFDITSPDNVAYKGANALGRALFGWDENQTVGGSVFDATHPRAGLGDNETSPAPGIIVTRPRKVAAVPSADQEDRELGALWSGMWSNEGGAVTGRVMKP